MNDSSGTAQKAERLAWPIEIRLTRSDKCVDVEFDDGVTFLYSAEYLRSETPSAESLSHGEHGKKNQQIQRDFQEVGIVTIEPIGNYAVRIIFDDGHKTGLYSWAYLYQLGVEQEQRWKASVANVSQME